MFSEDPKNQNPHVDPDKIDKYLKWATIAWFYVTVMAAIVRGGQMSSFDVLGVIVGTATAFGYWFKFSSTTIVAEAIFAVLVLGILMLVTVLIAWPLGYLGFS